MSIGRLLPTVAVDLPEKKRPISVNLLRNIVHPILNIPSSTVNWPLNLETEQTVADMLATASKLQNMAGLAAPQIGKNLRIFIHQISDEGKLADRTIVIINPKILEKSEKIVKAYEGCFSVSGYKGLVPRHETIKVEYYDLAGQIVVKEISNPFLARVFQHEMDHLEGILYYQRMDLMDPLEPVE